MCQLFFREEREILICCSTYSWIHWLSLVCALTRGWTRNLGILVRCSNQLSYPAKASCHFLSDLSFLLEQLVLQGDSKRNNVKTFKPLWYVPFAISVRSVPVEKYWLCWDKVSYQSFLSFSCMISKKSQSLRNSHCTFNICELRKWHDKNALWEFLTLNFRKLIIAIACA